MAGREITRQSSFERMMSLVAATDLQGQQIGTSETERSKAAYDLQVWWAKERKILQTRKTIQGAMNHISTIAGSIDSIRSGTSDFGAVQKVLSASSFISSLTLFLSLLPLDPSLKAKNSSARSSHTIGSAFFIHYFRQEVLLDDEVVDQSRESNECAVGAAMLVRTLDRFITNCRTLNNPTAPISNAQFKQSMLSYRFSVRYFLEKLEQWKELDASRLLQSLEAPYTESYLIFVTLSKVLNISDSGSGTAISLINPSSADGGSDDTNMMIYRAAEHQCMKIRQAMLKLLGLRAQTRIEELNAQIEAAINARTQDDDTEDENADTPLQTAASSVQRESNQTGIQRVENVTSMPTSPIPNLEAPLSPRREFKDITTILTRIATAGGLQSTSGDSSNSSGSLEGDFLIGDDRHRLVHELALDPTYKLPDSPNPAQINLSFYSRYYLPSPPSSNIETGGWSHMIQSPSYPRSPIAINTTPPAPLDPVSGEAEVMEKIRDRMKSTMLFMMDDNIVSSLSRSSVPKESLKQVKSNSSTFTAATEQIVSPRFISLPNFFFFRNHLLLELS